MRLRVALSMGGLLAVAGALNYVVVEHAAPGAGSQTLLVDLFAAVASVVLALWLTARYEAGIRRIASGLSEVARGKKDLRFDVSREPLVANLAHCANEAIASMAEPSDPLVGQVRKVKRVSQEMRVMDGDVGPVRVQPRNPTPLPEPAPAPPPRNPTPVPAPAAARPPSDPPVAPRPPSNPPVAQPAPAAPAAEDLPSLPAAGPTAPPPEHVPERRASQVPTVLPPAPATSSEPGPTPARGIPAADPATVRTEHFRAVFDDYRAGVVRVGESDEELEFAPFMEMLAQTEKTLLERHGCRAIRFSVLVEDGRVQLLPRLVR